MQNEAAGAGAGRQHPLAVALRAAFGRHRDAVLQAPTGAGKSTLVPLALLQEPFVGQRKILMLEPRRLAARAVAARMASLLGERVGDTVGYRMRLDTRVSRATRIEVVTEGVLTRLLQEDPALEQVACLIFDEYHERSLAADLGLALALDARRQLGAAFRVLIMSATLDGERVATLLGDAEVVSVPGRAFPVELRYLGRALPLLPGVAGAGFPATERVVCGAPRAGRVGRRCAGVPARRRRDPARRGFAARSGFAPGGQAAAALRRHERSRAGCGACTGRHRQPQGGAGHQYRRDQSDHSRSHRGGGLGPGAPLAVRSRDRHEPARSQRISRAASEQRAGRAGRVAPGICYRLWSEGAHASLAPATTPEILEADLAPLALELARWGADDATRLQWLDAPPAATLQQARELLARLDALNAQGRMTALGRDMARLPVHPRLAHMLLAARSLDAVELAAQLAALLSERDLLRRARPRAARSGYPLAPGVAARRTQGRGRRSQSARARAARRAGARGGCACIAGRTARQPQAGREA